jgi:D-lactate dehydrogenase (cytochrome)
MRDWVVNLTVVLADGSVIKTRKRPRKCSAGYNLNGLIVGSEGTLGIVTEATLKLAVVPEQSSVAVVPFGNIREAVSAAAKVIRSGVPVAALELMDGSLMQMVNASGVTKPREWKETPTLFFKFSGTSTSVRDNVDRVKEITSNAGAWGFEFARDEREQELLWSARKESLYSILALRDEGEDLCMYVFLHGKQFTDHHREHRCRSAREPFGRYNRGQPRRCPEVGAECVYQRPRRRWQFPREYSIS